MPYAFSEPPHPDLGELTCNVAFSLAKVLGLSPKDAAARAVENINFRDSRYVLSAQAHPAGYINFRLNLPELAFETINAAIGDPNFGSLKYGAGKKVIVEHTSVNPNKALHIGHARNSVVGDTLARIYRKVGYNVEVLNYIDDTGIQVADVITGMLYGDLPKKAAFWNQVRPVLWRLRLRQGKRPLHAAARPRREEEGGQQGHRGGGQQDGQDGPGGGGEGGQGPAGDAGEDEHPVRPPELREPHPPDGLLGRGLRPTQEEGRGQAGDGGEAQGLLGPGVGRGGRGEGPRPQRRHRRLRGEGHPLRRLEDGHPPRPLRLCQVPDTGRGKAALGHLAGAQEEGGEGPHLRWERPLRFGHRRQPEPRPAVRGLRPGEAGPRRQDLPSPRIRRGQPQQRDR